MTLQEKMKAIASLEALKRNADNVTQRHEEVKALADKHAHNYALSRGVKPVKNDEAQTRAYEEHKNYYHQHVLHTEHPELHYSLNRLTKEAPQARLEYKRALRSA